jgi:hypothetical protein
VFKTHVIVSSISYIICNAHIISCFLVIFHVSIYVFYISIFVLTIPYKILCTRNFPFTSNFLGIKFCYGGMWKISYLLCRPSCSKRFRSTQTVIKILSRNELCFTNFVFILGHSATFSDASLKRFGYDMV